MAFDQAGTELGLPVHALPRNPLIAESVYSIRGGFLTTICGKTEGKRSGKSEQKITITELALKLKRTERAIERKIAALRQAEIIARIGPAKGGHWEVLE
jgi:ATP-dependent DNA helicase RecG